MDTMYNIIIKEAACAYANVYKLNTTSTYLVKRDCNHQWLKYSVIGHAQSEADNKGMNQNTSLE